MSPSSTFVTDYVTSHELPGVGRKICPVRKRGSHRQSGKIIILVVPAGDEVIHTEILHGVEKVVTPFGYLTVQHRCGADKINTWDFLQSQLASKASGIIMYSTALPSDTTPVRQKKLPPLIVVNGSSPQLRLPTLHIDFLAAAFEAVRYLESLGHKKIACIAANQISIPNQHCTQGYIQGLRRAGLDPFPPYIVNSPTSFAGGAKSTEILMAHHTPPTAIFCHSDQPALGALYAAHQLGIQVPRELSLVGCSNSDMAQYCTPPLTTIGPDPHQIGGKAAELLLSIIEKGESYALSYVLNSELIVRSSTAPPLAKCRGIQ